MGRPRFVAIRVFFTRGGSAIWRADVPATLADTAGDAVVVLDPTSAEGRAVAPSVVRQGDRVLLYYETEGGVARATCADDGASCERDGLVLAGAASPGPLVVGTRIFLYFTSAGDPRIWVATGTDGLAFTVAPDPALTPSGTGAWDAMGLGDPFPIGGQTAAAELHVGLYFTGTGTGGDGGIVAIGYAAPRTDSNSRPRPSRSSTPPRLRSGARAPPYDPTVSFFFSPRIDRESSPSPLPIALSRPAVDSPVWPC